jgi:hypothetical protein
MEMERSDQFLRVLLSSIVIEYFIFCLFGLIGFMAFQNKTNQIIAMNIKVVLESTYSSQGITIFYLIMFTYGFTLFNTTLLNNLPSIRIIEEYNTNE